MNISVDVNELVVVYIKRNGVYVFEVFMKLVIKSIKVEEVENIEVEEFRRLFQFEM